MLTIEGIMAFGNVSWKDVTAVPMSGYVDQLKGIIQGKIDVGYAATVTPTVKELQAGPHKAGWILLPKANKAGWKRLQAIAPWLTPGLCKRAPGLPKGDTMEIGSYPYSIWSYAQVDPDIVYAVVKAMDKGFDIYKGMHRAMPAFNIKAAVKDPSPVPFHEGAIRYFKEVGIWTPELEAWQKKQLKDFDDRLAKFKNK